MSLAIASGTPSYSLSSIAEQPTKVKFCSIDLYSYLRSFSLFFSDEVFNR